MAKRPAKKSDKELNLPSPSSPPALRILPMQLQIGDRFTDEEGEWEIVTRPWTTRGGKVVHVSIQKPGEPGTKREKSWGAHERLVIGGLP